MSRDKGRFTARWLTAIVLCTMGICLAENPNQPGDPVAKNQPPKGLKITIGKETTWVTEPVGPDGFIDYQRVINTQLGQHATPENNAVVLLYRAFGPTFEDGSRHPDEFFQLLGIETPPVKGPYHETLAQWWKRTGRPLPMGGVPTILEMDNTSRTRPWTSEEFPEIAEWLKEMAGPLNRIADATERTEYYSPVVPRDGVKGRLFDSALPSMQNIRSVARTLLSRSMLHLGANDRLKAWSDLIIVHRLGRIVGRGPTIIENLTGIALESMAVDAELRLLSDAKLGGNVTARFRKQLESLPNSTSIADKVDRCERVYFLDACLQMAQERAGAKSLDWNEVLKVGNQWYDRMATAARLPTFSQRESALRKLDEELKQLLKSQQTIALLAVLNEKLVARQLSVGLLSGVLSSFRQAVRAESRVAQRFRNLAVALALSEWRGEHAAYPETLAELAPKYLEAIPNDLFIDQPLHYKRTADGYFLYSVGENGIDDKGRTFGDMPNVDDLIVKVPYSKEPAK